MLKYLIIFGVLIGTLPFWLPTSLGGATGYYFVLTDSMKGSLDPGSFVILRDSDSYKIGDAVGYIREFPNGIKVTILHRIVGRLPNGKFLLKGDAVTSTEEVAPEAVTGRLVFAVPALGFLPGAFRQAPLLLGGLLLAVILLTSGKKKIDDQRSLTSGKNPSREKATRPAKSGEMNLFLPTSILLVLCLPFLTLPVADLLPPLPALEVVGRLTANLPIFILLLGVMAVTRLTEVTATGETQISTAASFSGFSYGVVMLVVLSAVPFAEVAESARTVMAF